MANSSGNNPNALAALLFSQLLGQQQPQPVSPSIETPSPTKVVPPSVVPPSKPATATCSKPAETSVPPTIPASTAVGLKVPTATMNTGATPKQGVLNKRAAFLNKRSRATGAAYRNPNKKLKVTASGTASSGSSLGNSSASKLTTTTPAHAKAKQASCAFLLNEDFKGADLPDLLFPWKLHDLLDDAESNEDVKKNIVSWQADGVSFAIYDDERFVKEIMPQYFQEQDWDAFTKVLSSWGFVRFTSGVQKGAFIHRLLVKGKRSVCKQMRIHGKAVRSIL